MAIQQATLADWVQAILAILIVLALLFGILFTDREVPGEVIALAGAVLTYYFERARSNQVMAQMAAFVAR